MAEVMDFGSERRREVGLAAFMAKDYARAHELLLPIAEEGDLQIQATIGMLYSVAGHDLHDPVEAIKWLDLAVRAGVEDARKSLDYMTNRANAATLGEGRRRSFEWQQHSLNAENDAAPEADPETIADLPNLSPKAAFDLGVRLNTGDGLPIDYPKALACFRHAGEGGIASGIFNVGLSYYSGKGVTADINTAVTWFLKSVEAEHPQGLTVMAMLLLRGEGIDQDREIAMDLLTQAVILGDEQAAGLLEAVKAGAAFD